jgi:hypothetical protein
MTSRFLNVNLFWAIPATLAIMAIWGVSACANWYFGASLGDDKTFNAIFFETTTSTVFSSASLAADVLKGTMLFGVAAALAVRKWRPALVCGLIWVACAAWSVASATGFVAINHHTVTDDRGKSADEWNALKKEIARVEERRSWIPEHRPAETVQADLAGKQSEFLFHRTKGCTDVTTPESVRFCERFAIVKREEGNAKAAAELDDKLAGLRGELKATKRVSSENPWAEMAGGALGYAASRMAEGQMLWFALMLELISGPGLWAIWSCVATPRTSVVEPREVAAPVDAQKSETAALTPLVTVETPVLTKPERMPAGLWSQLTDDQKQAALAWADKPAVSSGVLLGGTTAEPDPDDDKPKPEPTPEQFDDADDSEPERVVTLDGSPYVPSKRDLKRQRREQIESENRAIVERFVNERLDTVTSQAQLVLTERGGHRTGGTPGDTVYREFRQFCKAEGFSACGRNHFGRFIGEFVDRAKNAKSVVYACRVLTKTKARKMAAAA